MLNNRVPVWWMWCTFINVGARATLPQGETVWRWEGTKVDIETLLWLEPMKASWIEEHHRGPRKSLLSNQTISEAKMWVFFFFSLLYIIYVSMMCHVYGMVIWLVTLYNPTCQMIFTAEADGLETDSWGKSRPHCCDLNVVSPLGAKSLWAEKCFKKCFIMLSIPV